MSPSPASVVTVRPKWQVCLRKAAALLSIPLAVASLIIALVHKQGDSVRTGHVIVGFWTLVPPLWFWIEWMYLTRGMTPEQLEDIKHTHDLSRNIWLALLAVLIALFGLENFRP
jgi:hypothetical protein